jgi:hypothetical protein
VRTFFVFVLACWLSDMQFTSSDLANAKNQFGRQ